ncbi:hypothetical protein [Dokdonella sp.]|uniref:hypothetical protein n=1 Tax=Dokdonella sp. TaxID=2291710 RepID=UPI003C6B42DC
MLNFNAATHQRARPAVAITWLVLILGVSGCGRSGTDATSQSQPPANSRSIAPQPDQLGAAISDIHLRAMKETAAMLQGKPSPDQIAAQFAESKQQWIAEMVALGQQVEKLDDADRKRVEAAVRTMYRQLQSDPALSADWQAFSAAINAYINSDPAFHRELKPLNILTQYAFFDLLREQAPREAERLGLITPASPTASTSQAPTAEGDPP